MSEPKEPLETLREIRSLMERSSRFSSLSGIAAIIAGITAIIGVAAGYQYLGLAWNEPGYHTFALTETGAPNTDFYFFLLTDVGLVLTVSLAASFGFTLRNARKQGQPIWDATAKRLLINILIPLITGAMYCLLLFYHQQLTLIVPSTIVFYGLALVNASRYTLNEIRFLGLAEIGIGLLAFLATDYGLLFWAFGFGVLHILYGVVIYFKYGK